MRGADSDEGDVRDALCEAVGVRPTLIVRIGCTVYQRAPNRRIAIEMAGGAPLGKRHRTIEKTSTTTRNSVAGDTREGRSRSHQQFQLWDMQCCTYSILTGWVSVPTFRAVG